MEEDIKPRKILLSSGKHSKPKKSTNYLRSLFLYSTIISACLLLLYIFSHTKNPSLNPSTFHSTPIEAGEIKLTHLDQKSKKELSSTARFSVENAQKAFNFAKSFPEYNETPLVHLQNLSKRLGLRSIFVKDESYRFNLNSFKGLGGSFAIGNIIARKLGLDISELPYDKMVSEETRKKIGDMTFITATDGNHGRSVAWTANRLKQKSVVYMSKGSSVEKLNNIKKLGAQASITDINYDDTIRFAKEEARKNGWTIVQDTTWDGYEEIPSWVMQGYSAMAYEAFGQLKSQGVKPTHIFLQAGVGAMAGGVTGLIASYYTDASRPIVVIVEPNKADCVFRTAKANDGKIHFVTGDMDSIMAGLACGEPCPIGWEMMKDHADYFLSVPDWVTAKGMRVLGNPLEDDRRVISGESGAVTTGVLVQIMSDKRLENIRKELKLNEESIVLCFSTEGDTDKESYRKIVWDGNYESYNK